MKKTELRKIMRRAWKIKKQNIKNVFAICLKMAWAEIKGVAQKAKTKFNDFRFEGFELKRKSNKYFSLTSRVNNNESKIVVNVADEHLLETKYGYALILDKNHVVFVKDWQVSANFYGNEVVLDKKYFNVKEWGNFSNFTEVPENLTWESWLNTAIAQQNTEVRWAK